MKITYSISDNELLSIYKDQWEANFDHEFPALTREETKQLKAELSKIVGEHVSYLIDQVVNEDATLFDIMMENGIYCETLSDLETKIEEERETKNQTFITKIDEAISLLEEAGYEVKKT